MSTTSWVAQPPVRWLVTANNPRLNHRYDGNTCRPRSGWMLHAVLVSGGPALCGLAPKSGWGCDLFEDDMPECSRCARRLDLMDPPLVGAPVLSCEKCGRLDRMGRVSRFTDAEVKQRPPEQRERYRQAWGCWCYRCSYVTYRGLQ
jgi:hypothetical protein